MKKIFKKGKNFLLVKERESTEGIKGRTVIRSSGYTSTAKAVCQNWILTQLETVPNSERQNLPDPFIAPQKVQSLYEELDCNVFNLFFLPECTGLEMATQEVSDYLDNVFFKEYSRHCFVSHSKGALFVTALTKYLRTNTNMVIITPTIGTIMGDERLIYEQMDKYIVANPRFLLEQEIALLKKATHITCSRRPIDYDMTIGSKFLQEDFCYDNLYKHKSLLIVAQVPSSPSILEIPFNYYGKLVGLCKNDDGMVSVKNQMTISPYVDKVIKIQATHPTALKLAVANPYVKRFLSEI